MPLSFCLFLLSFPLYTVLKDQIGINTFIGRREARQIVGWVGGWMDT
jgi:hypothetical protein